MSALSKLATNIYSLANRSGLMKTAPVKRMFRVAYFSYKKYLEDPFPGLVKRRPDLFRGGTILDIGANIGFTASVFCSAVSEGFCVYAFEPDALNYHELQMISERFKKKGLIEPILAAVGETEGEIELWLNQNHHADHRIMTDDFKKDRDLSGTEHTTVPLIAIDRWMESGVRKPVKFIKIDIQGYEIAALRGMKETLKSHPALAIEYCPAQIRELGFEPLELIEFIRQAGYSIQVLNRDGSVRDLLDGETEQLVGAHGYLNFLCEKGTA